MNVPDYGSVTTVTWLALAGNEQCRAWGENTFEGEGVCTLQRKRRKRGKQESYHVETFETRTSVVTGRQSDSNSVADGV